VTLERAIVWESGFEAQIECSLGPALLTFYDSAYALNRDWYSTGRSYQFVLCGIAYSAQPAEHRDMTIPAESPGARALRRIQSEHTGEPVHIDPLNISTEGMAALIPVDGWDVDDYEFHDPVVEVRDVEILGQSAWRVRAVLMRAIDCEADEDGDIVMEILVTQRAWKGAKPPQIGEDIHGHLWLQGHLWLAHADTAS